MRMIADAKDLTLCGSTTDLEPNVAPDHFVDCHRNPQLGRSAEIPELMHCHRNSTPILRLIEVRPGLEVVIRVFR